MTLVPIAECREVRRLLAKRGASQVADDTHEIADGISDSDISDAVIAAALLRGCKGVRPTNAKGARDLCRLQDALQRLQDREQSVWGDCTAPIDESLRRAAIEAGVSVREALALPEAVKLRLQALTR